MTWQPIERAPKGEMFIWAAPGNSPGKWRLGLAYWTASGKWADAYGAPASDATHCMRLPAPRARGDVQVPNDVAAWLQAVTPMVALLHARMDTLLAKLPPPRRKERRP